MELQLKIQDVKWAKVKEVSAGSMEKDGKHFPIISVDGYVFRATASFDSKDAAASAAVTIIRSYLKKAGVYDNFDYITPGTMTPGNDTTH